MKPKTRVIFDFDPAYAEAVTAEARRLNISRTELFRRMFTEWRQNQTKAKIHR